MDTAHIKNYKEIARDARKTVLRLIYKAQTSHIGSNFSCIDILTVLFEKIDLKKDKFILSKGWAAVSLYYFLRRKGKITEEELNSFCQAGSKFIGLAEPIIPEIPFAGGSMGLSFPAAVGFALSKKLKSEEGKIYVLMSDGEMQCGSTFESAMIATHNKLDNLIVIVDYNGFQAMGRTNEILNLEHQPRGSLGDKWNVFGWNVVECDGHKLESLKKAIFSNKVSSWQMPKIELNLALARPKVVIAYTIKGKGVSFMEGVNLYHYKQLDYNEYTRALSELNADEYIPTDNMSILQKDI